MKHKDYYNDDYVLDISQRIHSVMPEFQERAFSHALIGSLEDKELFARFDCIVDAMEKNMTEDYSKNIEAFFHILGPELAQSQGMFQFGWWLWPVGRYVERYGNENWSLSLAFLKELTKRFTGEYAIRPLLREHPKEVMDELIKWTKDENVHVRFLRTLRTIPKSLFKKAWAIISTIYIRRPRKKQILSSPSGKKARKARLRNGLSNTE